jgi:hypothetical protein
MVCAEPQPVWRGDAWNRLSIITVSGSVDGHNSASGLALIPAAQVPHAKFGTNVCVRVWQRVHRPRKFATRFAHDQRLHPSGMAT